MKLKTLKTAPIIIISWLHTKSTVLAVTANDLLPRSDGNNLDYAKDAMKYDEAEQVAFLPDVSLESAATTVIKSILGWGTIFTIIAVVVAGIYFIIGRGEEEDITKGKDILLYLIIGMAIMASAYAIVSGIVQFKLFGE